MGNNTQLIKVPFAKDPVNLGYYDELVAQGITSFGIMNRVNRYGCEWESLVDNNTDAPAVWDGGDTITPSENWKLNAGNPDAWLMNHDKPATSEQYPFNGMGRVRLQKNLVEVEEGGETVTKNLLTQAMFEDGDGNPLTNTVFVIQYDFTLGEDITVPADCVLEFDGGMLSNELSNDYKLIINDSSFNINSPLGIKIFDKVKFSGGHPRIMHTSWWGISSGAESDDMFEYLLNSADKDFSTNTSKTIVVVDNDIVLSRPIEATCQYADIKGINDGGTFKHGSSYVKISSSYYPTTQPCSLITLKAQETNIYGIYFNWSISGSITSGRNSILELYPKHAQDETPRNDLDCSVTGCLFSENFYGNCIKTSGRGLNVDSCGFSTVDREASDEGVICCYTMGYNEDIDYGAANEDQVRRLIITNNSFHTGRTQVALRLRQGSEGYQPQNATFKGVVFSNNVLDRGTRGIYCTAKTSGVLVTNNTFLFAKNVNLCTFYRGSSVNGLIFSNNIISNSGHNMSNEDYWNEVCLVYCCASEGMENIKNVIVSNNSLFRVKLNYGLVYLVATSLGNTPAFVSGISVFGNVLSDFRLGTYASLVLLNSSNLSVNYQNIHVLGNIVEDMDNNSFPLIRLVNPNSSETNTYSHIRIDNNTTFTGASIRAGNTDDPYKTDPTHWIDVRSDLDVQ